MELVEQFGCKFFGLLANAYAILWTVFALSRELYFGLIAVLAF